MASNTQTAGGNSSNQPQSQQPVQQMAQDGNWKAGLFECTAGEFCRGLCCYPCTVGNAVDKKDGNGCMVPCCVVLCTQGCVGIGAAWYRNQIREAYNIQNEGSFLEDMLVMWCAPCCGAIQMEHQTSD
eukprot:29191_1